MTRTHAEEVEAVRLAQFVTINEPLDDRKRHVSRLAQDEAMHTIAGTADRYAAEADKLARALLSTHAELARVRAELAEALRALNLRTGLQNWENAIKSRVAHGVTEVRCDACGGSGTEPRDRWDYSDDEMTCRLCNGQRYIMQDTTPKAAIDAATTAMRGESK